MKKKVFVTDDDLGVQDIFRIILEKAGYETTVYHTGKELLESKKGHPDLYILDRQLSGMDGLEICKKLKDDENTKYIPVIMISATPGLGELATKAGADGFIEKPFKKTDLLTTIAAHINRTEIKVRN